MHKNLFLCGVFILFMMSAVIGKAQLLRINGWVMDERGKPLAGASIRVKNTTLGTTTDKDGGFVLQQRTEGKTLVVSFMGRKTVEILAYPGMRVVLPLENKELETALVQVAYGNLSRYALTGAVSWVENRKITLRPVTNVTSALEGTVPGILVNNTYGQPGDAPQIRIRGFNSVNGVNEPLYVVDGVPFEGRLAEINPLDVESVSVLKDAAAAALYGNRAANGVVLISMKKADSRNLSMELTVRQGMYAQGMKDYDCVGTDEFMEVMWKSYRNSLLTTSAGNYPTVELANAKASASLVQNILGYNVYNLADDQLFDAEGHLAEGAVVREAIREDLDWYKPLSRKGFRQEYLLSGGAVHDISDYRFSLGYMDEEGFLKNAGFNRLTARLQMNVSPKSWLGCGLALSGNHQNQDITDGTDNTYVNVFNVARYVAPIYPVHLHDLSTGEYILDEQGNRKYDDGSANGRKQNVGRNIVWENELNQNRLTKTALTGQIYADVKLPAGFTFTLKGDLYLANQERRKFLNTEIGDGVGVGWNYRYQYRFKRYVFQEQLNWLRQFGEHQVGVLLGHENYYYDYQYTGLAKSDQILPDNLALSNFISMKGLTGYLQNYRTESYLGRIRYDYGGKYFAEIAFRRDGSSRFHPDHRWGNFGSVGLAWLISRENFLREINWLNYLKLRFSYGEVGNDASLDYYAWMSLYKIVVHGGNAAVYKSQHVAEDIKWEANVSYDAALEARLFKRLNLTLEYFDKRSKDLLFDVALPLSAGATSTDASELASITRNLGSVSNRGWEFSADIDLIHTTAWHWNIGLNATVMKNKILTLPEENRKTGIVVAGQNQKYMEGHSIYEWWLPLYAGVDRLTGNALYIPDQEKYYMENAEAGKDPFPEDDLVKIGDTYYTTNTSFARKDWCGSALPKLFGSFSSDLSWKGISFSALFTYSIGGKIYDESYASLMATGKTPRAVHRDILNSWEKVPDGMTENSPDRIDPDGIPVVNADLSVRNNAVSSRFLIDGSYLWVKNITAAYTLPGNVVKKLDLQGIRVNFSFENVVMFTKRKGMNPQQSFRGLSEDVLVAPRVISLGLTIKL